MNYRKARLLIIISSGLFLLTDQFLKWQAIHNWTKPNLIFPYFGWQVFLNKNAAFGLPIANGLVIALTIPIALLIGYVFFQELKKEYFSPILLLAWSLLLAGGISNLIDRIFYGQVIDYFLIGTAIINIGDIMIATGLGLFLLSLRAKRGAF